MSTDWKIKEFLNRYEDYKLGYMVIFKGEELKSLLEEVWAEGFDEGYYHAKADHQTTDYLDY